MAEASPKERILDALRDLEAILNYVALDSRAYADLVVQRLVRTPERLQQFPEFCRIVRERDDPSLRELIARPFPDVPE